MDGLFYDVTTLMGVIAFITVAINILKHFGLVKEGTSEQVSATWQTVIAVVLTGLGMFAPDALDLVPFLDRAAAVLAELGAYALAVIPLFTKLANIYHDAVTQIPWLGKLFGKQLTA